MKIAVSNIAWPATHDRIVAEALVAAGVRAIEIAPTKIWPAPLDASPAEVDAYRRQWESQGLPIIAAQALLFGHPELTVFGDQETRQQTLRYLRGIIRLCGRLGAKALVFGSPKNRQVGDRNRGVAWGEAIDFFRQLAETAEQEETTIVIEANPSEYGADFITHATEAIRLVRLVDHAGCKLHLDTACMKLANDDPAEIISAAGDDLVHFHASEPFLASLDQRTVDHARVAKALATVDYSGWISIEMRQPEPFDMRRLLDSVDAVKRWYG